MKHLFTSLAILAGATSVQAQTLIVGAGYADFSFSQSLDQGLISLEYQHRPFHQGERLSTGLGGALSVHENGDVHVGAGVYGIYSFNQRWFVEGSVMPGFFSEADEINDLGGSFQIRSLLGLGYTFDNGNRLSVAITHKSNASTNDSNPGVNAALLRYHFAF
ncbi:MAG: acyloxyacyl hydrolase [Ruegeria sp.]|uniref:acyloxyacyl hydrolase n=1 Tax=Ruegeria sp. TaxID=1879320 RepID=UPI00349EB39F